MSLAEPDGSSSAPSDGDTCECGHGMSQHKGFMRRQLVDRSSPLTDCVDCKCAFFRSVPSYASTTKQSLPNWPESDGQ